MSKEPLYPHISKRKSIVGLDDDQTPPPNPHLNFLDPKRGLLDFPNIMSIDFYHVYKQAQDDMIKAGWRKIKLEKEV